MLILCSLVISLLLALWLKAVVRLLSVRYGVLTDERWLFVFVLPVIVVLVIFLSPKMVAFFGYS